MTTVLPQCFDCRHFDSRWAETEKDKPYRCAAFENIPMEILVNEVKHDKPYPGDKGMRFEPDYSLPWVKPEK